MSKILDHVKAHRAPKRYNGKPPTTVIIRFDVADEQKVRDLVTIAADLGMSVGGCAKALLLAAIEEATS